MVRYVFFEKLYNRFMLVYCLEFFEYLVIEFLWFKNIKVKFCLFKDF